MIFTMLICIVGQGLIIPEVRYGAGRHLNHIDPTHIPLGLKYNFITQPLYLWGICLVKISIGFFLLRIASTKFYTRLISGIMIFMLVYTFACFLTIVLQCKNLAALWDTTIPMQCWGQKTLQSLSYTNVSLNILTDLLFSIFIPIPMLWNVQMNSRTKASIVGILSLGVFATAAAAVKVSYIPNYGKTGDWLWDSRDITIWTVLECNVGIVAGSLPCLKPLFRHALGSTYGWGSQGQSGAKPYNRSYGAGTGHSTHNKKSQYNSLGSSKAAEADLGYGATDEAHMMTNIRSGKESQESVYELGQKGLNNAKFGGIHKTTEVDVVEAPERNPTHMV